MIAATGRLPWLICLFGLGLAGGCGGGEPPSRAAAFNPDRPVAAATLAASGVTVDLVNHAELLERIAAHRGRVVVLDCWSTSCPPCVQEFPGLVSLARDYGAQVTCLSLSFDYEGFGTPEEVLPPVQEFLSQVGAGAVENLLGREDSDTLYQQLELTSVPAVYVYGRDGRLLRRFDDDYAANKLGRPFSYADVRKLVDQALAGEATAAGKEAS